MTFQAGAAPAARHAQPTRHAQPARGLGARLAGLRDAAAAWSERRRQHLALAALDDTLLRDIGLSRADVECEVGTPFWRG